MREFIISVMAKDRPGIVAAVSGAICELGGNITHLSETVLRGYFTIILSAEMNDGVSDRSLRESLEQAGRGEYVVSVLPYQRSSESNQVNKEKFILTARCRDQKGIIHRISKSLADDNINIDDFYAYIVEGDLIMILEIGVTTGTELSHIQQEVEELGRSSGISISLQHEDIFRATTELQAVLRLGDRR